MIERIREFIGRTVWSPLNSKCFDHESSDGLRETQASLVGGETSLTQTEFFAITAAAFLICPVDE